MKQLLLRVEDELHAALAEKAKREHRSVNAIANDLLSVVEESDTLEEIKIKARMVALGVLAPPLQPPVPSQELDQQREHAIESMRGAGELIDSILDEDRDRLR